MSIASKHNYTEKELRELDAWIAEHVMGWKLWMMDNGNPVYRTGDRSNPTQKWFEPTERAASAMQVLEKCAEKLSPKRMHIYAPYDNLRNWMVSNCESNVEFPSNASAPTLPLAICLFARQLFSK